MIGKIVTGKSFRGCLSYLHEGRNLHDMELQRQEAQKKQAEVIHYNQCFGTKKKQLVRQFVEVSKLNPKVGKSVFHASISLAHEDAGKLTRQDKIDIAVKLAEKFGFQNNQFVAITHADTDHEHLHIVGNRIGYDGKTASDSNSYKRVAEFCRTMEKAYNLKPVLSPGKFLSPAERQHQGQRIDQRKEAMKKDLKMAIQNSKSVDGVAKQMERLGYQVERGRGISFTDDKQVRFKGSQLGYSLADIQKQLALQQQQALRLKEQQRRREELSKQRGEDQRKSKGISM